jgi:RimJ/RimL family protein N-acetyltransferase
MLHHRLAILDDLSLYFDWANDPDTRRQSFSTEPIPMDTHRAWFARQLADPNALLLVFETDDTASQAVGQVRFARETDDRAIISLSVAADFRGQGLASRLIDAACAVCAEQWGSVTVLAYIRPENAASVRAFGRAGFGEPHKTHLFDVPCLLLTRTL